MQITDCPVVTVSVTAYNSSKFIIETLESIKSQTYPNLILQISDDCSTDNTVQICKDWIEKNKTRFVKTKLIVPEHNTGISGNANRAWDACETEFFKGIAGDDILMPNCIQDNLDYVVTHQDAVFTFSKVECFGAKEKQNEKMSRMFDYSCFEWTQKQQLDCLLNANNFVPASTAFVNIKEIRRLGIRHDERIPHLEDIPKWVNVLRSGLKLHFMDKTTVRYRISEGSLSTSKMQSPRFRRSLQLFWYYYCFEDLYKQDKDLAIIKAVDNYMNVYNGFYSIFTSRYYKIYSKLASLLIR